MRIERVRGGPGRRLALRAVHLPTGSTLATGALDDSELEIAGERLVRELRLLVTTDVVWTTAIDDPWRHMRPVDAGCQGRAAESHVLVAVEHRPTLRIDAPANPHGPFARAIRWGPWIAIGHDAHVDLVGIETREVRTLAVEGYFSGFHRTLDALLVASAERVHRISRDGGVVWTSPELAIDGVVIGQTLGDVVPGEGEWDPPGGWRPFELDLESGRLLP